MEKRWDAEQIPVFKHSECPQGTPTATPGSPTYRAQGESYIARGGLPGEQVLHTPSTRRTLVLFTLGFLERFHLNKELHSFKKYLKAKESELHGLRVPQGSCQGTKQTPSLRRNVKKQTQGDRPPTGTAALGQKEGFCLGQWGTQTGEVQIAENIDI